MYVDLDVCLNADPFQLVFGLWLIESSNQKGRSDFTFYVADVPTKVLVASDYRDDPTVVSVHRALDFWIRYGLIKSYVIEREYTTLEPSIMVELDKEKAATIFLGMPTNTADPKRAVGIQDGGN